MARRARGEDVWAEIEALGRRLRKSREAAGLTQVQMAEKLGVSQPMISNWERGENLPDDVMGITARWAKVTRSDVTRLRGTCFAHSPAAIQSPLVAVASVQQAPRATKTEVFADSA